MIVSKIEYDGTFTEQGFEGQPSPQSVILKIPALESDTTADVVRALDAAFVVFYADDTEDLFASLPYCLDAWAAALAAYEPDKRGELFTTHGDDDSNRFRLYYKCPHCDHEWEDDSPAMTDDDCPACGEGGIGYDDVADIDEDGNVIEDGDEAPELFHFFRFTWAEEDPYGDLIAAARLYVDGGGTLDTWGRVKAAVEAAEAFRAKVTG